MGFSLSHFNVQVLSIFQPHRQVFSMMHYNHDSQDIARPSEVLARIQSYMASLRTLELYGEGEGGRGEVERREGGTDRQ